MLKHKAIKIIIIIALVFLTILTIHLSLLLIANSMVPKLDQDELKECYVQNKEIFDTAAMVISSISEPITVYKNSGQTFTDKYHNYYITKEGLYIEVVNQLSDEDVKKIGDCLVYIFKNLKFYRVNVHSDNEIYFIEGTNLKTYSGLIYIPTEGQLNNKYILESQKITDNWYVFISE